MTYWLLNSAVIAVGGDGTYTFTTIGRAEAVTWLQSHPFVSRIGYPENADFIRRISGVLIQLSREESLMQTGDEALVVRPVYRLQNPNKRERFTPTDGDFVFGILRRLV